jgi:hypothetical protein
VSGLDFFVDVVVTGSAFGVGVAEPPEEVARIWGPPVAAERDHRTLLWDYGLVEFYWARSSGTWHPNGFQVHAHRLGSVDVPQWLLDRYGAFGRRLPFTELAGALDRWGYRLTDLAGSADYRRYRLDESRVSVYVAATAWDDRVAVGDVWSIDGPSLPERIAATEPDGERDAVRDGLAHLVRLDGSARVEWLDRHRSDANRLLYLCLTVDGRIGPEPVRRPEWVGLRLWLLRHAYTRGVFTAAEVAEKTSYFVLDMLRRDPASAVLLPTADEVVRACLAAIPVGIDRVARLDDRRDLYRLSLDEMRASRHARNLVSAAQWHLDGVRDGALADELREWLGVKARLV